MSAFILPRFLYHGAGVVAELEKIKAKRAMIVMGGSSVKKNGALATANNGFRPQNLTFPAPASNASSMFNAPHAGNYFYAVAGITARGQSTAVVSAQAAVAGKAFDELAAHHAGAADDENVHVVPPAAAQSAQPPSMMWICPVVKALSSEPR